MPQEINNELLRRVYEDINLGILDNLKDPDRWGNLIIQDSDGDLYSVNVIQFVKNLMDDDSYRAAYFKSTDAARAYLDDLERRSN